MRPTTLLARLLSCAIVLLAFGLAVYRAKVQPIAHDEAKAYEFFLDQGVYHVLSYDPGNHVLQTLLAKPIVKFFGVSEFTLRVASLIGAAVYLLAVYLLSRRLFGDGIVLIVSVGLLSLNPQVMDFMVAARGYGLGLAALAVAMYCLTRLGVRGKFDRESQEWRWGCRMASVALAFAVVANLTNIVPAFCLAVSFALVAWGGLSSMLKLRDSTLRDLGRYFVLPGVAVGFCIMWPFLIQFRLGQARTNLNKASDAIRDVFTASFLNKWTDDVLGNLGGVRLGTGNWQGRVTNAGEYVILPLLFCVVLIGLALALRAPADSANRRDPLCRIFGGAAIGSVVLTVALHFTIKVNYPFSRYCLFLIPLFTVAGILAAQRVSSRFPSLLLKGVGLLIAAVVLLDYAFSLNTKTFRYNAYDAISLDIYQVMEKDARARGLTNVRVGGTWWYEPEVNFYRISSHGDWMLPYDIKDRSYVWQTPNSLVPADYDYFLYTPANDPALSGPRVRTIFRDDKTQLTIIAIAR